MTVMTATPRGRGGLLRRRRTRAGEAAVAARVPVAVLGEESHTRASGTTGRGATRDPRPPIPLQVNALQAMCRQVFGFRLAMIALAAPAALLNASPGLGARLVGAAVVVTFMGSYALFRDWERFGPLLLRHPTLLAVDTLFGTLLLISAGPDTTLAYVSVCTPSSCGIVYGWRGAACFASLQSLILLLVHATLERESGTSLAERLLLPGLCVITGAVGSTLRNLMLRFGTATLALTTVKARLAVTQAVAAERARLAREMHDSVAKTLHGVALAADGLARSAGSTAMDPDRVRQQAELVARAARRAAAESRELLTDLRRETDPGQSVDLLRELAARTGDFAACTGLLYHLPPHGRAHHAPRPARGGPSPPHHRLGSHGERPPARGPDPHRGTGRRTRRSPRRERPRRRERPAARHHPRTAAQHRALRHRRHGGAGRVRRRRHPLRRRPPLPRHGSAPGTSARGTHATDTDTMTGTPYGPTPHPREEAAPMPDQPPRPAIPLPEALAPPPRSTPVRVLVADDNPVVRAGLTALLSGHEDITVVAEAADGRQAYEAALRHRPDLVLLDVRMPDVDGLSALPHLVRIAPVVMLTYSSESEIVQEALRRGRAATWYTASSPWRNCSPRSATSSRDGPTSRPRRRRQYLPNSAPVRLHMVTDPQAAHNWRLLANSFRNCNRLWDSQVRCSSSARGRRRSWT